MSPLYACRPIAGVHYGTPPRTCKPIPVEVHVVQPDRTRAVVVRVERVGDETRFAMTDTGVGIPADSLKSVFGRYRQVTWNDRRGMGLGLYISQSIVQGHGGRIWAENRVGKPGSAICFTLPIDPAA